LEKCIFDGNKATQGNGGAIYNSISADNIEIQDSVFHLNFATWIDPQSQDPTAHGRGGGIWNQGALVLNRVTLDANSATGFGGGLANKSSSSNHTTVANSTITANIAATSDSRGGGIWNDASSEIDTTNTTIAENVALLGL